VAQVLSRLCFGQLGWRCCLVTAVGLIRSPSVASRLAALAGPPARGFWCGSLGPAGNAACASAVKQRAQALAVLCS